MDLPQPVVPGFLRELAVYQRLIEAEKASAVKEIWDAEKETLRWAAGVDHKLVGSYIDASHIRDLLEREFNRRTKSGDAATQGLISYMLQHSNSVMEALVMRGFAAERSHAGTYQVRITPDGFLAGTLLVDTDSLRRPGRYGFLAKVWLLLWWFVLAAGIVIVVSQFILALITIGGAVQSLGHFLTLAADRIQSVLGMLRSRWPLLG